MDLFPDWAHVRLRCRVRGAYLHADENGVGVSLRARRASMNAVWQVHLVPRDDGVTYVLLQSAAYGRYLARSPAEAPRGYRGNGVYLRFYNTPEQENVLWVAVREGDHVRLRHFSNGLLRANGRRLNSVSVDDPSTQSTMTDWTVEAIPPRAQPPALPLPSTHPEEFLLHRAIVYVQADDLMQYDALAKRMFWFRGRSVSNLKNSLANHIKEDCVDYITLCVRAGFQAWPIPMVVDLPRSQESIFIIVLTSAVEGLIYPDTDAEIFNPVPRAVGLELFPDGAHVRLYNRVRGAYLQADEDGWNVSLTLRLQCLRTVWLVHRLERDGKAYILFHSAAYGRYLGLVRQCEALELFQGSYTSPTQNDILWEPIHLGNKECRFKHAARCWYLDLTGGKEGEAGRRWDIEAVPATTHAPILRPRIHLLPSLIRREVICIVDYYGNRIPTSAVKFKFDGRSSYDLRAVLAKKLKRQCPLKITLCLFVGSQGRLTPLIGDLPDCQDLIAIAVLETGSPTAQALVYPKVDA